MPNDEDAGHFEPNAKVMKSFLIQLTARVPIEVDAQIELAWDDGRTGRIPCAQLFALHELDRLVAEAVEINRSGLNVYVGAACRGPDAGSSKRSSDSDVVLATALWADFDDEFALRKAISALAKLRIAPSIVVVTGTKPFRRGHIWLLLKRPTRKIAYVVALNHLIQQALHGDKVTNAGRIMRLPGSVAWPRKEERVAEMTRIWSAKSSGKRFTRKMLWERLNCDEARNSRLD